MTMRPFLNALALAGVLAFVSCDDPVAPPASAVPSRVLVSLVPSAGALVPGFSPDVTLYTVRVPSSVTALTLTATPASPTARVVSTGGPSLAVGTNRLTVTVTAPDGAATVYTVNAVRDLVRSTVSTLTALGYTGSGTQGTTTLQTNLSPPFTAGGTAYQTTVVNAVTSVTLVPTKLDPKASWVQTGGANLSVGANTVTLEVTAEDGTTKTVYTLTVNRLSWGAITTPPPSNDSSLGSLVVTDDTAGSPVTLSPVFAPSSTDYLAEVPSTTSSVTVTATPHSPLASAAGPVTISPLPQGYSTVLTNVYAEDGSTTVYRVMVHKLASGVTPKSSDSTLVSLALKVGTTPITLNPAFSPAVTAYTATLPPGASSVAVTAVKNNALATVGTIAGATGLVTGSHQVSIPVTAEDGSVTTYTVMVSVPAAVSTVSSLASLAVSGTTLSPAFSSATTAYTGSLAAGTTTVTVTALPTDPNANVVVTGNTGLVTGTNTVKVTVTATDGVSKTTYTLTVTVAPGGGGGGVGTPFSATAKLTGTFTHSGTSNGAVWVWVTDAAGVYLETVLYYPPGYPSSLRSDLAQTNAWKTANPAMTVTVDAVAHATYRSGSSGTFRWPFKNAAGSLLPQGTYTFHIMIFEENGNGYQSHNTVTVALGGAAVTGASFTTDRFLSAGSVGYVP